MQKKVALITGANRGVGKAVALHLAEQDFHIALVGRTLCALESVSKIIESKGGSASCYLLEMSDHDAIAPIVERIKEVRWPDNVS